ncbi:MAG: hypothetical protein ABI609_03905 [Acidobacteriota bacterium]
MDRKGLVIALGAWAPALAVAALAAGTAPAGWRVVKDHKGNCQMQVPADWKGDTSAASPEDHSGRASIHLLPAKDWADSKSMAQHVMAPTTVLEDSPERLWFAYGNSVGKTDWYVSVPGPLGPCTGQITFKSDALAEVAKQIAASVAVSPNPPVK